MDEYFPQGSVIHISSGIIEKITSENNTFFITVFYANCRNCRRSERVRLAVENDTLILDENGQRVSVRELRVGMTIHAIISSAMTRSIPPQSSAYLIRIIRRPATSDNTSIGRIINIDTQNRSFTTIRDGNVSSLIRFNVPADAIILDRFGNRMGFSRLVPGMRVRVRHASFMTASIPPQTTAFEIRVI